MTIQQEKEKLKAWESQKRAKVTSRVRWPGEQKETKRRTKQKKGRWGGFYFGPWESRSRS